VASSKEGIKRETVKKNRERKRLVVDVAGLMRADERHLYYTTPEILEEVREGFSKAVIEEKVRRGEILVKRARNPYLKRAVSIAEKTGDKGVLSRSDLSLLALSLELSQEEGDVILKTDDYALQNIALTLGLQVETILGGRVRERIRWRTYCKECGSFFPGKEVGETCPECSSPLTRKAISKARA
jgi:UPF0271 protein